MVDRDHAGHAVVLAHVVHMALQVGNAALDRVHIGGVEVFGLDTAVVLQGAQRSHDHTGVRAQAGLAALDVDELLRPQVGTEAGLGDHVFAQFEGGLGGGDGVAAVGDVGKGAAVDDGRVVLQRLHQVGFDGVFEQGGHGAMGVQVTGTDGGLLTGVAHDDVAQAFFEVFAGGGQAEDGHDFGGHDDVKAVFAGEAVARAAQGDDGGAQGAVVHVHDAAPDDAPGVKAQGVAVVDVVVHERGQQVVRQGDGVEVAGEVQVDVFHGHDLGVAAAGCAAFHAKDGAQGRLTQGDDGALADAVECIAQTDGGGGFAFTSGGGADGGNQNEFAVRAGLFVQPGEVDLGFVVAVGLQGFQRDVQALLRHLHDGLEGGRLGDFNVG